VSIRFLADADLNQALVDGVRFREPALDFLSAVEAGLEGMSDRAVLDLAADQDRILVSHDASTMPVHFVRSLNEGKRSPGVFLVSQDAVIRDAIDAILLVWSASSPADWANQIHHLPSLARHIFSV
jgi:predicted nuclease of predicted toxin-antitoxin system